MANIERLSCGTSSTIDGRNCLSMLTDYLNSYLLPLLNEPLDRHYLKNGLSQQRSLKSDTHLARMKGKECLRLHNSLFSRIPRCLALQFPIVFFLMCTLSTSRRIEQLRIGFYVSTIIADMVKNAVDDIHNTTVYCLSTSRVLTRTPRATELLSVARRSAESVLSRCTPGKNHRWGGMIFDARRPLRQRRLGDMGD